MGGKKKLGKDRLDKYYKLAKEQGYRSRAAFKLIQINKKFNFLGKTNTLIDLCAAPGSWLQVASKLMPVTRCIIGVDLHPIKPIPGVITLCQDITTSKCKSEISQNLKGALADVVLHDGAPNVGTAWIKDAYSQSELTLSALKLAVEFLVPNGLFITKIFRSADYNTLLWVFHQLFKKVSATKPVASRSTSAEIFVVCEGYLAPKKIDPKLLDPKAVFKEMEAPMKTPNLLVNKRKDRPNQEGYQTDSVLLFKRCSVLQFIHEDNPVKTLAEHNEIVFEVDKDKVGDEAESDREEIRLYLAHKKTTEEIKECLKDTKVLNAKDFKLLLKWRQEMRMFGEVDRSEGEEEEKEKPAIELNEEQKADLLQQEMEDSLTKAEKKKQKKLREKEKKREKFTMRQGILGGMEDEYEYPTDDGVFNLKSLRKQSEMDILFGKKKSEEEGPNDDGVTPPKEGEEEVTKEQFELMDNEEIYIQQDEPRKKYKHFDDQEEVEEDLGLNEDEVKDKKLEQYLDILYDQYLTANDEYRRKLRRINRNQERKEHTIPEDLEDFSKYAKIHAVEDEIETYNEPSENKLVLNDNSEMISHKAALWFDSELFGGVEEEETEGVIDKLVEETLKRKRDDTHHDETGPSTEPKTKKIKLTPRTTGKTKSDEVEEVPAAPESETEEEDNQGNGLEELPEEEVNRLLEEFDEYDLQTKAEMLSLGSMLKDPQKRAQVLEKTLNKYSYRNENLPDWFKDEEKRINRPHLPVTKEMVSEYKQQLKAIDARSSKKVAEAQARKRKKFKLKLEKARVKTKSIVSNSELSEKEKMRQIQKIYKGQLKVIKPQKVYVFKKKIVGEVPKGKNVVYKTVDPRLKKDKRGKQNREGKKRRR